MYMIVNFRVYKISRDAHKLIQRTMLIIIIKNLPHHQADTGCGIRQNKGDKLYCIILFKSQPLP